MAKLGTLPDMATIIAMRGRVDFYDWKGIACARSWPSKSTQPRTAGEIASSDRFRVAAKATSGISPRLVELYRAQMTGIGVTWIDMFRAGALGKPWMVPRG